MKLPADVECFEELAGLTGELHLAIGVFDGVHLGHKAVIESAVFSARRSGGVSGVLTFDPHPSRLFRPEQPTLLMMEIEAKTAMLHGVGVDVVIRKHFDGEFASISAEDFSAAEDRLARFGIDLHRREFSFWQVTRWQCRHLD